jgi:hypothetical protein
VGKSLAVLLIATVGVGLAGFANYHRNAPLDRELEVRPYGTISDDDLKALIEAYSMERDGAVARLGGKRNDRTRVMDGFAPGDLDGKLKAFDSFQRKNERWRDHNRQRIEFNIELEKLKTEQGIRDRGLHEERNRILRRVLTF